MAVKLWIPILAAKKLVVTLSSDNIAALSLVAEMKASISALIARELALILSETAFQPRFIQHLPGVMNQDADALSRIYEPGGKHEIPQELKNVRRMHPPLRDTHYYSTLAHTPQGGGYFSVVRAEWMVWVVCFVLRYIASLLTVRLSPRLALSISRVMVRCGDGSNTHSCP